MLTVAVVNADLPTRQSHSVEQLIHIPARNAPPHSGATSVPVSASRTEGTYNLTASFRMDEWEPSDEMLEAAMEAIEKRNETRNELRRRVVAATVNDIDGLG